MRGEGMRDLEAELDRLYGLPLEEFTAERNAPANRVKNEGGAESVAAIRALPKPSLVAWTVNQLSRQERAQLDDLLTAADGLRAAQVQALGGSGADELRQAQEAERQAVQALTHSARRIL